MHAVRCNFSTLQLGHCDYAYLYTSYPCRLGSVAGVERPVGVDPFLIVPSSTHLSWEWQIGSWTDPYFFPHWSSSSSAFNWVSTAVAMFFCLRSEVLSRYSAARGFVYPQRLIWGGCGRLSANWFIEQLLVLSASLPDLLCYFRSWLDLPSWPS